MNAVGLVPNAERPVARALAEQAVGWLSSRGVTVRIPNDTGGDLPAAAVAVAPEHFADDLDLVICLGGDGTMLHTFTLVYPRPVPILGVNAGQLGYLSALEAGELEAAIPALLDGDFDVSERSVVECTVQSAGSASGIWYGLNELVLEKVHSGKVIRLEVGINGQPFTSYAADGVIVATPTGSTAYSFSARGPIVSPSTRLLVLTPVSPHMLFDRPLVLAGDETLEFVVRGERAPAITIDGRELGELGHGDRVVCRVADAAAHIVAPRDRLFHQILKAKFALPDR
jgi:NAD+ kinase